MKIAILGATAFVASLALSTAANAGNCRDPWITQAIKEVTGREPNGSGELGECTYTQYRGGSWNNYGELKAAVQAKFPRIAGGGTAGLANRGGVGIAPGASAAGMVAAGGGNMVAAGGGNMVAAGGGNLVGNDGASMRGR